jgi:hypothetical protein
MIVRVGLRFPNNLLPVSCGDIGFKKVQYLPENQTSKCLYFPAFRALLPSANYSAERFGWVWQPVADSILTIWR